MPLIKVTKADLMKTVNLEPGWYSCVVIKVHDLEKSKAGNSFNQKITAEVEGTGKQIDMTFNSLLWGKLAPLWKAVTGQELVEGEIDTSLLMSKKFDGNVGQRAYEGNLFDEIQAFLPFGASKGQTVPF